jgi:hypothetical protein
MTPSKFLRLRGKVFTELLPSNGRKIHRHSSPTILLLLSIFVSAGTDARTDTQAAGRDL